MRNIDRHARASAAQRPPDELILAAVERAARHSARNTREVPIWAILDHLGIARRSSGARHVRSRVTALQAAGALEPSRRHGVAVWALTRTGRRWLAQAPSAEDTDRLPESPQHAAWRNARTAAAEEIARFRERLREALDAAAHLLDADPPAHSDAWFELAARLQRTAWRVASASHCLYEWPEPDDARADIDDHAEPADESLGPAERARRRARRAGRRNIRLWRGGC